jgi:hypothetical protein
MNGYAAWTLIAISVIISITLWNIAKLIVEEVEAWREAIYSEKETKES